MGVPAIRGLRLPGDPGGVDQEDGRLKTQLEARDLATT